MIRSRTFLITLAGAALFLILAGAFLDLGSTRNIGARTEGAVSIASWVMLMLVPTVIFWRKQPPWSSGKPLIRVIAFVILGSMALGLSIVFLVKWNTELFVLSELSWLTFINRDNAPVGPIPRARQEKCRPCGAFIKGSIEPESPRDSPTLGARHAAIPGLCMVHDQLDRRAIFLREPFIGSRRQRWRFLLAVSLECHEIMRERFLDSVEKRRDSRSHAIGRTGWQVFVDEADNGGEREFVGIHRIVRV